MKKIVIVLGLALAVIAAGTQAQDKVKYCKNFITGEIITVEVNMPCPTQQRKFR